LEKVKKMIGGKSRAETKTRPVALRIHGVMEKFTNLQKNGLKESVRVVFTSSPPGRPASDVLLHKQNRDPSIPCSINGRIPLGPVGKRYTLFFLYYNTCQ